ncbi:Carboxymuconolactone decarboxylase family protein [Aquisphaera giovannonii]|uniref:Carboxymuconolactone decarboxylase family protein n=1 Tax=Aquisphaera giovannonii TaxID=406548 RepID=A0A5B9W1D2_9BACT|nr:carboxymuconolactone decarboxylase family protein [Aquisphaera giovannonii]QEH34396.1 Carboxymuconolactone decarboxylase family protein [Aquisphaera giovannonii]
MIRSRMLFSLAATLGLAGPAIAAEGAGGPPTPLTDEEAWKALPEATAGRGQPLPAWARSLAREMPRTAAALLRLDYVQRARSPLDPKLRAAMRWTAAHANRCAYAEAYALADARRAGLSEEDLAALRSGDASRRPAAERAALEFARKMTVASSTVTDDEFAALVKAFGEKDVVAMVLLMAYSNFQDRLLTCLGTAVEPGGPRPPLEVQFAPGSLQGQMLSFPKGNPALAGPTGKDVVPDDPRWAAVTYDALQEKLERQRSRTTRVRVPSWDEVVRGLPADFHAPQKPVRIVWTLVCLGHQPELAAAWETLMRTAGAESRGKMDRVFSQGLFWVVTKTVDCPYCMGHCEMNWEVAGLDKSQIAERSRLLAGDDWSAFPPEEQRAFAFARKLTGDPGSVTREDVGRVIQDFGVERGINVLVYASRCNYMVRVSNGFQLSLERDNVFFDYYSQEKPPAPAGVPAASRADQETWKRLPATVSGGGQALPSWATAIATRLPRTAAAMLELDFAQRTKSPLDPALRAKMRWAIAHANHCAYSEATALADLKRAGADEAAIRVLTGDPSGWPEADREPLEFARLLTVAAPTIGDDLFARLRERFGAKQVASMVLLAAYGNFQDRIVLGLNLPIEAGGPLPPVDVKFAPGAIQMTPLPLVRHDKPTLRESGETVVDRDPEWSELSYDELQSRLERQRARSPRLPIPVWDDVKKTLPPALADRPIKIVWTLVCMGYVPELAIPWNNATRTLWAESPSDRVFEESLFWVETRAIRCNYCMGHCEMLMEVGGLDKSEIDERTRRLAGDDWSAFPPAEQRAYAYARKLAKTPWQLTSADYATLENDLGSERAMAVFWWLCRGLYMTRVSDGFQLPLERENVFRNFFPPNTGQPPAGSTTSK